MLTGEYRAALDEKGRLLIPTKLRSEIQSDTMILTKGMSGQCLWLFTQEKWDVFSKTVQESLGMFDPTHLRIRRWLIGSAMELDLDKTGRIGISAIQREYAGLVKDCLILGIQNYLEIWDESIYMSYMKDYDESQFMNDLSSSNIQIPWPKG